MYDTVGYHSAFYQMAVHVVYFVDSQNNSIVRSLTEEQTMDLAAVHILLTQGDHPLEEHVSF